MVAGCKRMGDMKKACSRSVAFAATIAMICGLAGFIDGDTFLRGGGTSPIPQAYADEALTYAQPGPEDFEFANGTIEKLKASYVASLTDEQKKNVRLVIPDEINGTKVTAIADMAFYSLKNQGLTFTQLDLSQTTSLQSIGSNAFRYALKAPGDLILPNTVTTIGESAFADCGFDGVLHLPDNPAFTMIPGQAFLNTKFTGTLNIPANVKVIDRMSFSETAFSGELVIPEGVTEMYASAFAGCANITAVSIPSTMDFKKKDTDGGQHFKNCSNLERVTFAPNSHVTTLYSEMFNGCSKLTMLDLPDSIVKIDAKAFYSCGLKTVYLPARAAITANENSFFFNCSNPVAVCDDKASYDSFYSQLTSSTRKYLGYPTTVSFDAGSYGTNPASIERLVGQPLNRVKDEATGLWTVDGAYDLPNLSNAVGEITPWYSDAAQTAIATKATLATDAMTLYAGAPVTSTPAYDYQEVFKVYDGQISYLKAVGSHPLAKKASEAQVGDFAFYHMWVAWDSLSESKYTVVKQGFDENTLAVCDVADSRYGGDDRIYSVQSYLRQKTGENSWTLPKSTTQTLLVQITPAAPTVNPVVSADVPSNLDGFPGLALSEGDTPGTLEWDAGQTLADGTNSYAWTFTPAPPAEGKPANYKSASGAMELRVSGGAVVQHVEFDVAGGTVIDPVDVAFGEPLPATYVPTKDGYVFAGWYQDAALTQPFPSAEKVSRDMTLHARWEERIAAIDPGDGNVVVNDTPIDQSSQTIDVLHTPEVADEHKQVLQTSDLLADKGEPSGFFELNLTIDGEIVERAEFDRALPVTVAFPVEERTVYTVAHLRHDGTIEVLETQVDVATQTLSFSVDSLSPFMVVAQKLCDVTFDSRGGTSVPPVRDVAAGSHISAPDSPTKDGAVFQGWGKDAAGTQMWDFATDVVQDDMTLYALWKTAETPGTDDPDTPETPDTPDTPDAPDTPIVPDVPDTPDTPDIPDVPDTPIVPDNPEAPDNPDAPDDPDSPSVPPASDGGADGDTAVGSDSDNAGDPAAKPLPATSKLPKSGDTLSVRSFAALALLAIAAGAVTLRARRHLR